MKFLMNLTTKGYIMSWWADVRRKLFSFQSSHSKGPLVAISNNAICTIAPVSDRIPCSGSLVHVHCDLESPCVSGPENILVRSVIPCSPVGVSNSLSPLVFGLALQSPSSVQSSSLVGFDTPSSLSLPIAGLALTSHVSSQSPVAICSPNSSSGLALSKQVLPSFGFMECTIEQCWAGISF